MADTFTVLWDNDGVLVDTERLYFAATREALALLDVELSREQFIDISLQRGASMFELARGVGPGRIDELRHWRNARYGELLRSAPRLTVEGIEAALDRLAGRVAMGVVTSSRGDHFEIIHARSGLLGYFDFVLTREQYEQSKPAPDPYLAAMVANGLTPDRCVAIEDSHRGVASASAAGVPCIAVPNELTAGADFSAAHRVVGSADEAIEEVLRLAGLS